MEHFIFIAIFLMAIFNFNCLVYLAEEVKESIDIESIIKRNGVIINNDHIHEGQLVEYHKIDKVLKSFNPNRYFPIRRKKADWPKGSVYYRVILFDRAHSGSYDECYATRAGFIKGLKYVRSIK
jgi:hypothetical protein